METEMRKKIDTVNDEDLTWKDPLASQVISDDSDFFKGLSDPSRRAFRKPFKQMKSTLPEDIRDQCDGFVDAFDGEPMELSFSKLRHNRKWHETTEVQARVTKETLQIL
jgi:hypothetical protein